MNTFNNYIKKYFITFNIKKKKKISERKKKKNKNKLRFGKTISNINITVA